MNRKNSNPNRNRQRGIGLFLSIFALLLLTGIAAAMLLMATTDTSVNSNYRNEQIAYFGAKAGTEEARARMMSSDPHSLGSLPINVPTTSNNSIIYIINSGSGSAVQPWSSTNAWADDELCHDGYLGMTAVAPDVRCNTSQLPTGSGWYTSVSSALPFNGSAGALPFKWARIAPKLNGSVGYLTGSGSTASISYYNVNSNSTYAGRMVCWDGQKEVPLATTATHCSDMLTASNAPMSNVYLITTMGVSSGGARKMLQSETALTPVGPFIYGLYATSGACPAISFTGNNPSTDSYTTAGGQTYSGTHTTTGGDVGANGAVAVGNGNIGGIVGVLPSGTNPCATPFSIGANGTDIGRNCPGASPPCVPNSATYLTTPYSFPTPPAPNPLPPNTSYSGGLSIVPGTYGNISLSGNNNLVMAPGTYNINSISMTGNSQITVNPPGAVTLNIGGVGQSTPLQIAGNGISDDTLPNDFMINYGGTGGVSITGNGNITAILNAPNAAITQAGNGNWYGSILGSSMTIGGNAFFHFDRNAAMSPPSNGYYTLVGYHAVSY